MVVNYMMCFGSKAQTWYLKVLLITFYSSVIIK